MKISRVGGALLTLGCLVLLSSCALVPSGSLGPNSDNPQRKADLQMQRIAAAVKDHDAVALKGLFSPRARENAADLDSGADYFLSVFPSGRMTWKSVATNSAYDVKSSKETEELFAAYTVRADGREYSLDFIDFPVNDVDDPKNVGLYALGVAPYTTEHYAADGTKKPFYVWLNSFQFDNKTNPGRAGIYVPEN